MATTRTAPKNASQPINDDADVGTGTALRLLGLSYAQLYRYIERGVVHPFRNGLPPQMRTGHKKHTHRFRLSHLRQVAKVLEIERGLTRR